MRTISTTQIRARPHLCKWYWAKETVTNSIKVRIKKLETHFPLIIKVNKLLTWLY